MPDTRARFKRNGTETVGITLDSGLPNITGQFGNSSYCVVIASPSGAVYAGSGGDRPSYPAGNGSVFMFDASRSNKIYGSATIVRPPTIVMRDIIKY